MNLFAKFSLGLGYEDFLARHANDGQKSRWRAAYEQVVLTPHQCDNLAAFSRQMNVLCLAGAWCGDCINQCPIFEHFAKVAGNIRLHYFDRDEHPDLQKELQINGGNRVPVLVFFSEDGFEVARYGERTLSKYRQMVRELASASCPTGINLPGETLLAQVTHDWLNEFERVQWLLRLSSRLRQKYQD